MKQKYSHTYAELTKLQNQIRVELNRVRPRCELVTEEHRDKSSKRLYHQKFSQTSICQPPEDRSQRDATPTKRYFQKGSIIHENQNKQRERRHYEKSYADRVDIASPITRKTSSYLNVVKVEKEGSKCEPHHTSIFGIGKHDKSLSERGKSGKRIFPSKYVKLK